MANVMLATRTAASDIMTTVSKTTGVLSSGADSLSNLAQVAQAHSELYRDTALAELKLSREDMLILAEDKANARVTEARLEIRKRLDKDPAFKAEFDLVQAERKAKRLEAKPQA